MREFASGLAPAFLYMTSVHKLHSRCVLYHLIPRHVCSQGIDELVEHPSDFGVCVRCPLAAKLRHSHVPSFLELVANRVAFTRQRQRASIVLSDQLIAQEL